MQANMEQRRKLVALCFKNIQALINHEFGNFVVQQVINPIDDDELAVRCIYEFISRNLTELAKVQYASRVVEASVLTMPCQ